MISILQWTIRDELPKRRAVTATPWDVITQYGILGTIVQTGGYGDGFGFVPGEPRDDALIVAQSVRELAQEARFADVEEVLSLFGALAGIAGEAPRLILGSFSIHNSSSSPMQRSARGRNGSLINQHRTRCLRPH
ncbi:MULTISPECIES: hypothetical protein [unclassified Bradyrhizobium]|uniref:hypothetical protein n=1 Tax=unclassified Bradyrhizobium TaxID=2631580 RepID=UPI002915CDD4|nr:MULTISPECIES: hypothetical protein [unclassified Bradyrhizobium]